MTPLPKHLEEMRDELLASIKGRAFEALEECSYSQDYGVQELKITLLIDETFNQAASIMLKDMEEMAKALEFYENAHNWTNTSQFHPHVKMRIESWDAYHPDNNPDAPYCERVGGKMAREALKIWREKYKVEEV